MGMSIYAMKDVIQYGNEREFILSKKMMMMKPTSQGQQRNNIFYHSSSKRFGGQFLLRDGNVPCSDVEDCPLVS